MSSESKYHFSSWEDIEGIIIKHINSAKTSIEIICFEMTSKTIINKLISKRENGIKVKAYLESRKHYKDDKLILNEFSGFSSSSNKYHSLHEKLIIIDKKLVIIGSPNLTDKSLRSNYEIICISKDPKIVNKSIEHLNNLHDNKLAVADQCALNKNKVVYDNLLFNCKNKPNYGEILFSSEIIMYDLINNMILSAKYNIDILASHKIEKNIYNNLVSLRNKGVNINIIKDVSALDVSDYNFKLIDSIRYIDEKSKMHIKAIIIDNSYYVFGSLNLFNRSLYKDLELVIVGNKINTLKFFNNVIKYLFEVSGNIRYLKLINIYYNKLLYKIKST